MIGLMVFLLCLFHVWYGFSSLGVGPVQGNDYGI